MAILEPKIANEVRDYLFNWLPYLGTDLIATSVVTVVGATLNSSTNTNTTVTFWISGGTNGTVATVTNTITTAAGRTETEVHTILIRDTPEPILLSAAKAHLRLTDASEDAYISELIPAARRYVENRSGIILVRRSFVERNLPMFGAIQLSKGPIKSITEVAYKSSAAVDTTYAGARFFAGSSVIFPALGGTWPAIYAGEKFSITYVAGLSQAELADDEYSGLVHAMKLLLGHWFANRESVAGTDGASSEVPMATNALCDQVRQVLV